MPQVLIYDSGTIYYVDSDEIYDPFPDKPESEEKNEEDSDTDSQE